MYDVRVDSEVLGEIIRRLVAVADPERIILFGSRARAEWKPDSDLDLLLIKDFAGSPRELEARAYASLRGLAIPVDILCYTPDEAERRSKSPNHVIARALREGRVLYERPA